ncbi:LPO_1073/Vpar_1526 family protein [Anaerotignum lactatifermentans]|uniref:LPO_1073/Vpar_1526 family protein n=1 Tax=Anaerotignum lactatifermentans TaxID=160404 RepID=UPI0026366DFA|nr:LPO_1073/Vpar_1526 family protein [Anaerotignum lactatifermentans]
MKFGNDSSVTVENNGENQGMITGANYGSMTQNQYGLGYSDTKALCLDIVHDEIAKYRAEALIEAQRRSEELFESIVRKLDDKKMTDAQALAEFRNPAMQFDYFEAQKAYMKAGTPELAEMLSDILVERISESSRSLLQIALGEAIRVAPKLIPAQMATLALIFNIRYSHTPQVDHYDRLVFYLKGAILPIFKMGVSQNYSEFQHLYFAGCCQQQTFGKDLIEWFKESYSGVFMQGFMPEEVPKDSNNIGLDTLYPCLFTTCTYDSNKIQIAAFNKADLLVKIKEMSILPEHSELLQKTFKDNLLPNDKAKELVEKLVPEMKEVFEYWNNSVIKNCILSSVGIVIAAEYSKKVNTYIYDLKMWI